MEILVVTWNFPPRRGGIEYLISNLCEGLKRRHCVAVVTGHAPASQPVEDGVFRAPWPGLMPFAAYSLWRGAWFLFHNPEMKIIFGGSVMVTPLALILARLFGRKAVIQAHGLDVVYPKSFYQFLCVRWLKFCDRIIANSAYTAALIEKKGAPPHLITVVPPGVHAEHFNSEADVETLKKQFGLEAKRIILFVGRLAKRKGVKEFIQYSLPEIIHEVPNVCFVVVGDNPKESLAHREDVLAEIEAVISEAKLQNYVRLLGPLDDDAVTKLYQICDLVVLPALATTDDVEGFGIVLLEAAAAGKPVVATRVGGIPDAVEDGKSGVLVEPGNYGALGQAVLWLLRDLSQARAMGATGRQRTVNLFAWTKICQRYAHIFSSAISAAD
jgi:phosphatidyl-myo-inositol dimannoside synthase